MNFCQVFKSSLSLFPFFSFFIVISLEKSEISDFLHFHLFFNYLVWAHHKVCDCMEKYKKYDNEKWEKQRRLVKNIFHFSLYFNKKEKKMGERKKKKKKKKLITCLQNIHVDILSVFLKIPSFYSLPLFYYKRSDFVIGL